MKSMEEEYESLLCAALLHDIGKFYQRAHSVRAKHWEFSTAFVEHCQASFCCPDLVKLLVGHHHESQYTPESARPQAITDERQRILSYLISRADNFSSKERSETPNSEGVNIRSALDTIFSQIDIGKGTLPKDQQGKYKYHLSKLFSSDGSCFPEQMDDNYQHPETEYENYVDQFLSEFKGLFPNPYPNMSDTLTYLIQKYLWCIPSDTTRELKDVSLADHMKTTCALAACFYKYHEENGWEEKRVKDDSLPRIILVYGDLSGIQNYIYDIASIGEGGVAKRLRARSFLISALSEAVALRVLKQLDLPIACKIISAGGQFYLLLPNTNKAKDAVSQIKDLVSEWIIDAYGGDLAITMVTHTLTNDQLQQGRFDEALECIHAEMAKNKLRKFENILAKGAKVFEMQFKGRGACQVCNKYPAETDGDEIRPCKKCSLDEEIGRKLISAKWLVFSKKQVETGISILANPCWYASLIDNPADISRLEPIFVYNIKDGELLQGTPSGFAMYAGYVPRWSGVEEYKSAIKDNIETAEEWDYSEEALRSGKAVKSFSAIAAFSQGISLLGILRADVDHLGLIFSIGMQKKASISRITNLSNMLNMFFTYELVKIVEKEFPDVYVVYSGGDDLMLVGPWDKTIELSKRIADEFARFTAFNPNITLSAGIGTYKPKVTIAISSVQTGEILEQSKAKGRNRLTTFQTTIEWGDYQTLKHWADALIEAVEKDEISKAFIYRLFNYQRKSEDYYLKNDPRAIIFKPHLAYDIGRNFVDKDGSPKINRRLYDMLTSLLDSGSENIWRILKASISWCLYATRKESRDNA